MKKILFLSVLLLSLAACENDPEMTDLEEEKIDLTVEEIIALTYEEPSELSDEQIVNSVREFEQNLSEKEVDTRAECSTIHSIERSFINPLGQFSEKSAETRGEEDIVNVPIYTVRFKTGHHSGLALVASRDTSPVVLAYIPQLSNTALLEHTGAGIMLDRTKGEYLSEVYCQKQIAESLRQSAVEKVAKELKITTEEVTFDRIKSHINLTKPDTRINVDPLPDDRNPNEDYYVSPRIKVNWGEQGPNFTVAMTATGNVDNNVMFYDLNGAAGSGYGPIPLGSINVAIAQLLTWIKPNSLKIKYYPGGAEATVTTQEWAAFDKDPNANTTYNEVSSILYHILKLNKSKVVRNSSGVVVGCNVDDIDLFNTLNKWFTYTGGMKTFVPDTAFKSLFQKQLVMAFYTDINNLRHAFLFDGMVFFPKASTRTVIQNNDGYWHVNFCMNNECTGYYRIQANQSSYFETPQFSAWTSSLKFIPNIKKK